MSYRLDELASIISPACPKHSLKLGGTGKGIQHNDTRPLGSQDLKPCWKSDFTSPSDGVIEAEFPASIKPSTSPVCDIEAPTGLSVKHALVVEMVVGEEVAPIRKPGQTTPTGIARVLRMQFAVVVTERGGLGISWDEEQPPVYEDVPGSPPSYACARVDDFEGELEDGEGELEVLR